MSCSLKLAFICNLILTLCLTQSTYCNNQKPLVIFSHGFGGSKMRALLFTKGYSKVLSYLYSESETKFTDNAYLFDPSLHRIISFNYPDVFLDFGIFGSIPNLENANVAQQQDINHLNKVINRYNKTENIIGYGYSRGAATWINALSQRKFTQQPKALILEAPFAAISNTFLFSFIQESCNTILQAFAFPQEFRQKITILFFNSLIQKHDIEGIQPINKIENISNQIPILFIHAKDDFIIPINDSRNLYLKLAKQGRKNIYLLELEAGGHGSCLWGKHGALYRNVVHAFYKKHNLPYSEDFANNIDLKNYQPSCKQIKKRLKNPKKKIQKRLFKDYTFNTSIAF